MISTRARTSRPLRLASRPASRRDSSLLTRAFALLLFTALLASNVSPVEQLRAPSSAPAHASHIRANLSAEDDAFLEDLSRRAFRYFWEQADPRTGLVLDRA